MRVADKETEKKSKASSVQPKKAMKRMNKKKREGNKSTDLLQT